MNRLVLINPKLQTHNSQTSFSKNHKDELTIIFNNKSYPLPTQLLNDSTYFSQKLKQGEKICIQNQNLQNDAFEMILSYFNENQIVLERNATIIQFFQIIKFLQVKNIEQQIIQDIQQNFDEYSIFQLIGMSVKLQIDWLYNRCFDELKQLHFEQLCINKYDLLQCEKQLFQFVIVECLKYQIEGLINGPNHDWICKLIKQYSQFHRTIIDQANLKLKAQEKANNFIPKSPALMRKRSATWNCRLANSDVGPQLQNEISKTQLYKNQSCNVNSTTDLLFNESCSKKEEVFHLKMINCNMMKNNNLLISQIEQCKVQFQNQQRYSSTEDDLDQLEQKYEQIQKIAAIHDKKIASLKSQVEKLTQELSKQSSSQRAKSNPLDDLLMEFSQARIQQTQNIRSRKVSAQTILHK